MAKSKPAFWASKLYVPHLRARPTEVWLEKLMRVPCAVRAAVASIVWWDYADVSGSPREFTAAFEPWLDEAMAAERRGPELAKGLRMVGYEAALAQYRSEDRRTIGMRGRGRPRVVGYHRYAMR